MPLESDPRFAAADLAVGSTVIVTPRAGGGVVEEIATAGDFEGSSSANHHLRHLLITDLSSANSLRA